MPNGAASASAKQVATSVGLGTGAGALVFVLAQAWVQGTQDNIHSVREIAVDAHQDATIAIQQASQHGLNMDVMRNEQQKMQNALSRLEAMASQGPRFTADQGRELEQRVRRLEGILLPRQRGGKGNGE